MNLTIHTPTLEAPLFTLEWPEVGCAYVTRTTILSLYFVIICHCVLSLDFLRFYQGNLVWGEDTGRSYLANISSPSVLLNVRLMCFIVKNHLYNQLSLSLLLYSLIPSMPIALSLTQGCHIDAYSGWVMPHSFFTK